jgi:hypothetical protein
VTKLSNTGNTLIYSTYLGGGGGDAGEAIAVDGSGNAYVTGVTGSSNFPILNPFQGTYTGGFPGTAFITKLSSTGSSLIYSTYLGGGGGDAGFGIAVDGRGNAYVTGNTSSSNFPTLNPYQTDQGDRDAFVTKLSRNGASLIYSTFLGGGSDDYGRGIAVDGSGNVYVSGETGSSDFPTLNPYQMSYQGGYDAFVSKLTWTPDYLCGDVNSDGLIDLRDLVFLRNYVVFGGPAPQLLLSADVNCSGNIDLSDVVFLKNFYFNSGPAPCVECN